ncbi:MAG: hypothetical protein P1P76_06695 [Anaerolineales bacterium]|nr:hypothetical protein [Anaerolineales bacterium]
MIANGRSDTIALDLTPVTANSRLAGLIPARIAIRHHALPIAETDECVIVAMADPTDNLAIEQISLLVGKPLKIVHADRQSIDASIEGLWSVSIHNPLRIMVLARESEMQTAASYARWFGSRLRAGEVHTSVLPISTKERKQLIIDSYSSHDLVILEDHKCSRIRARVRASAEQRLLMKSGTSFLLARKYLCPLRSIMCLLRGVPTDLVVARWATRLARNQECSVQAFVLVPSVPLMYGGLKQMQVTLETVLNGDSLPGQNLRRALNYLSNQEVHSSVHLLQGYAPLQILDVLQYQETDLMLIAAPDKLTYKDDLIELLIAGLDHSLMCVMPPKN